MKTKQQLKKLISDVELELENYEKALSKEIRKRGKLRPKKLRYCNKPSCEYEFHKNNLRKNAQTRLNHFKQLLERIGD